jgi:hypothetical protein
MSKQEENNLENRTHSRPDLQDQDTFVLTGPDQTQTSTSKADILGIYQFSCWLLGPTGCVCAGCDYTLITVKNRKRHLSNGNDHVTNAR